MEQRASINNSSLVLAPCLGIHNTRSLCRFEAVHGPKTSLSLTLRVCVSSCVNVCVCVSPPQVLCNILCTPLFFVQQKKKLLIFAVFFLLPGCAYFFFLFFFFWQKLV